MPNASRTSPDVQFEEFSLTKEKLDIDRTSSELGKNFQNQIQNGKNLKINAKMQHVNKKKLARKLIFVTTPFSHSTLKLESENFTPQNHSLFRSTSRFGVTKITTPI